MIDILQAQAILLLFGGGMNAAEIALLLALPEAEVCRMLRRARDLKRELEA